MSVLHRDAVATVRTGILPIIDPTPIYSRIPTARPDTFLLIRRVGGVERNVVTDEPTLAVEGWSMSEETAHDLLQLARAAIADLVGTVVGGAPIYKVTEFAGPAFLPDPESQHARFTYTVAVALRGVDDATL